MEEMEKETIETVKSDVEKIEKEVENSDFRVLDVTNERENEKAKEEYNASDITVLEGLEGVRIRPGMYIGTTSAAGLHHLVWEIVDNAVDEALAGYCTEIGITINKDNSVTVSDNGRGIPVDIVKKTGLSGVETVYTKLHAGGKFGQAGSGYKVAGGLHGVGASVVNGLSKRVEIIVNKDGGKYLTVFVNGGKTETHTKRIGDSTHNGTIVTFTPDETIFTETTVFNYETIRDRARQMAFLNRGVRFSLKDDRVEDVSDIFCYEGGIKEYVSYINTGKKIYTMEDKKEDIECPVFYCEGAEEVTIANNAKERIYVEIAFQYRNEYDTNNVFSYCNNIATINGGTHEVGFRNALVNVINDYAKNYFFKNKDKDPGFQIDDCLEGITAIVSIKHPNPQYEGQTKGKLGNSNVRSVTFQVLKTHFMRFLLENKKIGELIVTKAMNAQRARIKGKMARESERAGVKISTLAGKLSTCSSKNPEECELFIVEGNSAAGTAKDGRDAKTQAVLPLRGKILNTAKANESRIFGNAEIGNLITAINAGYSDNFDISKIRYHKVVIMTDADVDGSHIRILLLTFFFNFMRPLIQNGNVYVAQPPLYKVDYQKKKYYAYSDEELEQIKKQLNLKGNYPFQRYKGLGEMDKDQLADTTMDPLHRKMLRVTLEDCAEASRVFTDLMGEDVEPRKDFILKNAKFVKNLDI